MKRGTYAEFDLLLRWFVGLGMDDPVWNHSTFSKNRDRLLDGDHSGGRNSYVDFRGKRRSNQTHTSTTDPDAKLYHKGPSQVART